MCSCSDTDIGPESPFYYRHLLVCKGRVDAVKNTKNLPAITSLCKSHQFYEFDHVC